MKHKSVEDGKIFVIDLAGSENASDTQFHDKSRAKESQAINKSLMALKVRIFLTNYYATHQIFVWNWVFQRFVTLPLPQVNLGYWELAELENEVFWVGHLDFFCFISMHSAFDH